MSTIGGYAVYLCQLDDALKAPIEVAQGVGHILRSDTVTPQVRDQAIAGSAQPFVEIDQRQLRGIVLLDRFRQGTKQCPDTAIAPQCDCYQQQ